MNTQVAARNATLDTLVKNLNDQQEAKLDVVAPSSALTIVDRRLHVANAWHKLSESGVEPVALQLDMSDTMIGQLATRLGIPVKYMRRMHEEGADNAEISALFDHNANAWLAADQRAWLVRAFRPDEDGNGYGRAALSNKYRVMDNLDVLTAALDGLRSTGIDAKVSSCDLSEHRMRVRIEAPEVAVLAPELLRGYRSPYGGAEGTANPTVFAGFEVSNSETGGGRFTIVPRLVVQICSNGMRMTKDAIGQTHLGGALNEGVIEWSDKTNQISLELVRSQTTDMVRTIMNVDYMRKVIADLETQGATEVWDADKTIKVLSKQLRWSETERAGIFNDFIRGGQTTASGWLHATTSYAQQVTNPDRAAELEEHGMDAMALAAKVG